MARWWKWIAGSVLVAAAVIVGLVLMSDSTSPREHPARSDVVDITANGRPLVGEPMDLVAVGRRYVGLVKTKSGDRFVTSDDGVDWKTVQPVGLPKGPIAPATYPGGLGYVDHVLFSDGDAVYLRVVTGWKFKHLGAVSLYVSNADASTWRAVTLPAPAGEGSFPISATTANGRRYIVGSVYEPRYGRSYLDAAVWISSNDGKWRRIAAPAFSSDANQTVFALDVVGHTVVAGGGDGSLRDNTKCCNYGFGAAFWLSADDGEHWSRATARDRPYHAQAAAAIVGFANEGTVIQADVVGTPARTAQSEDQGATWTVVTRPRTKGGRFPQASQTLRITGRFVATTTHGDSCTDCTEGAIALSDDGAHWRDVTPRFPCGTELRTEYGFISRPEVIGSSVAVLAACGKPFVGLNETLLGTSSDRGAHWRVTRFHSATGDPLPAVAGNARIVTLAGASGRGRQRVAGPVRAVVVHP